MYIHIYVHIQRETYKHKYLYQHTQTYPHLPKKLNKLCVCVCIGVTKKSDNTLQASVFEMLVID